VRLSAQVEILETYDIVPPGDYNKHESMYGTSTVSTLITSMGTDFGVLIGVGLGIAVTGATALVGLGFAWRHITKRVTGKKF